MLAVTEALSECLAELVMSRPTRGIVGRGLVSLVLVVIWVPFTLVITQNKFDSDENSSKAEKSSFIVSRPKRITLHLTSA